MFGAPKACAGCSGYHQSHYLIKDITEGQGVVALERRGFRSP